MMSFTNPILKHEWGLTSFDISILTSLFYLGITAGSTLTGRIADKQGRVPAIEISAIFLLIVSSLFVFINNFYLMCFMRFVYGINFGFSLPLTTSLLSEIMPINSRGRGIVFLNFLISIGKLFGVLLAVFCLDDFSTGNWKLMVININLLLKK
jgi:putative MFS transporter